MTKSILTGILAFAALSTFTYQAQALPKKHKPVRHYWSCTARNEHGRTFTSKGSSQLFARSQALNKCETWSSESDDCEVSCRRKHRH